MNIYLILTIVFGSLSILFAISWVIFTACFNNTKVNNEIRHLFYKVKFALGYITILFGIMALVVLNVAINFEDYTLNRYYILAIIVGCLAVLSCILSLILELNYNEQGYRTKEPLVSGSIIGIVLFMACNALFLLGDACNYANNYRKQTKSSSYTQRKEKSKSNKNKVNYNYSETTTTTYTVPCNCKSCTKEN